MSAILPCIIGDMIKEIHQRNTGIWQWMATIEIHTFEAPESAPASILRQTKDNNDIIQTDRQVSFHQDHRVHNIYFVV